MATRRERVILELEDRYTSGLARATAATAIFKRELGSTSGRQVDATRTSRDLEQQTTRTGQAFNKQGSELDRFTGRAKLLANVAASLMPTIAPIGAVAIPAVTGLASGLGFLTLGLGTTVFAVQGLGDALKAMNDAALDPTDAKLTKARQALELLSPAARDFARELPRVQALLAQLRAQAGEGVFPGFTDAAHDLEKVIPRLGALMQVIGAKSGEIAADVTGSLASGKWDDFLQFLEVEGPKALGDFATAGGHTVHALAQLWMATTPLNDDFSSWLVEATKDLDTWASHLSETQGFQEFVAYIEENGPQVARTFGAIGNAVLQIVEASAPLGGPVLRIIESLANALATIADSPAGTPLLAMVTAMSTLRLATSAQAAIQDKTWGSASVAKVRAFATALTSVTTAQQRATMSASELAVMEQRRAATVSGGFKTLGRGAATLGLLAVASSGVADKFGLANTASLALAGSMAGPWGAAVGAGVGLVMDFVGAHKKSNAVVNEFISTLDRESGALTENSRQWVANQLLQAGVLKDAQDLGISLSTVTDAAMGQGSSLDDLNKVLDNTIANHSHMISTGHQGALVLDEQGQAAKKLRDTMNDTNGVVQKGAEKGKLLADATKKTIDPLREQGIVSRQAAAAQQALREASQATTTAFLDISAKAKNAKVSLDDLITDMENQAKALEEFGSNTAKAAKKHLDDGIIKSLQDLSKTDPMAAARRMKQFANATGHEIARANHAWEMGQVATAKYQHAIGAVTTYPARHQIDLLKTAAGLIPTRVAIKFDVQTQAVINKLHALQNRLFMNPLHIAVTTTGAPAGADGMTVPGPRHPYGDKVLIHAAPGEEVITNRHGEADQFRADRAAGRIPAYADGGTVGHRPMHDWLNGGQGDAWTQVMAAIARAFRFDIPHSLGDWKKALDRSGKAIDKERAKRDDLVQSQSQLIAAVSEKLRSDLFTSSSSSDLSVWLSASQRKKAASGDVFSTLRGDISNAEAFKKALATLKRKGLNGAAFENVAENADLNQAQALAAMSSKKVRGFEWLFNRRQQLTGDVGRFAGSTVYGKEIAAQTKHLSDLLRANHLIAHRLAALEKYAKDNPKAVGKEFERSIKSIGGR